MHGRNFVDFLLNRVPPIQYECRRLFWRHGLWMVTKPTKMYSIWWGTEHSRALLVSKCTTQFTDSHCCGVLSPRVDSLPGALERQIYSSSFAYLDVARMLLGEERQNTCDPNDAKVPPVQGVIPLINSAIWGNESFGSTVWSVVNKNADCPKRKSDIKDDNGNGKKGNPNRLSFEEDQGRKPTWVVESGASLHICRGHSLLSAMERK